MKSYRLCTRITWLSSVSLIPLIMSNQSAVAACTLVPTAGNDTYICDSGTGGPLTDTGGNNSLTMPTGGTGTITGPVTFAGGVDTVIINSGTINGDLSEGAGNDRLELNGGTVNGTIFQNGGTDTFIMTGGVVQRVEQGSELDTATVSGGWIVGQFFAGDFFTMTGGRIGEVNLEQANNEMRMSGGTIDGFVIAAQGRDLFILSGGSIGTFVDLGSGDDRIFVTGGSIGSTVTTAGGSDQFTWDTAGTIGGAINLGAGNDTGTLQNLTEATLSSTPSLNGGAGTDTLTFANTSATTAGRYVNWENVSLTSGSSFTLDSNFVLGDSGTATGSFAIDASSTLLAGNGVNAAIAAFTGGQLVNVTNSGTIDLTNGSSGATDTFTVLGNYTGRGGAIRLQTVLGDDSSASDRFIISGGTASGTTGLEVTNLGGAGAATVQDGILVVQAVNGATTSASAFGLSNAVAAGAFEYALFRGGVSAGSGENWYLRSSILPGTTAVPGVDADDDVIQPPGPGVEPPNPGATPVVGEPGEAIPLYRVEAATYAVVPPAAREAMLATLGTFHERRGEQSITKSEENFSAAWGRVFGQSHEQSWSGTVDPSVDGNLYGFQMGLDMLGRESEGGHSDVAGLFFAYSNFNADVTGQAVGWNNVQVGSMDLDTTSFGGYWTHFGPSGWYLDGVLMGSWFGGDATSERGVGIDLGGSGFTASLEGGYPVALSQSWTLEPQAQLIWNHLSLDDESDAFSDVGFDSDDGFTGRLGFRLQGKYQTSSGLLQPYVKANLWHNFSGTDAVLFGGDALTTELESTSLEFGAGVTHDFTKNVSAFAVADYTFDVDGGERDILEGNIGLRVKW
ncbi:autotransporter outer membrane beta-barrel domain-containing protein [Phyllobacterium brassicacearum]|uniref:Autotransporter outer membrane beta-barrel domain-containing protein n=2 Tax=Phyllobacterium brassicacearum TaxID=314235 RepID=A0A2P7BSH2_9HYPH|nr:autotransporter outer membrane beta-barrel domain-containing protein [Phyllobacterium brassicacearum]TDQ34406.1 outer membrane autotransporter protein [Phyllobacterium brassicacearum]